MTETNASKTATMYARTVVTAELTARVDDLAQYIATLEAEQAENPTEVFDTEELDTAREKYRIYSHLIGEVDNA